MDFSKFPKDFNELSEEQKKQVKQAYLRDVSTNEGKEKLVASIIDKILTFGPHEPYTSGLNELVKMGIVTKEDAKSILTRGEINLFFQRYFVTIISNEVEASLKRSMIMWFKRMMKRKWGCKELLEKAPDAVGMSFIWIHEYYDKKNDYEIPPGLNMFKSSHLLKQVLASKITSISNLSQKEFDENKDKYIDLLYPSEDSI